MMSGTALRRLSLHLTGTTAQAKERAGSDAFLFIILHLRSQLWSPLLQNLPGGCNQPGAAPQPISRTWACRGGDSLGEGFIPQ